MSFAVIDFETTGILPDMNHRVVELGVVHVENDGTVSGRWETLLNPGRDLGRQDIHGIRAAEVLNAPGFADIAGEFASLLHGRVVAGHNVSFDLRFLLAEFERAGHPLQPELPNLCTMRLGGSFGLGGNCGLGHACATLQIPLEHAHTAGDDAEAAARLLGHYRRASATWEGWDDYWAAWDASGRAYAYPPLVPSGVVWQARSEEAERQPGFLERLANASTLPVAPGAEADFLALLDRCLLDGHLSASESDALVTLAQDLGLARRDVEALGARYYDALVRRAWADDVLTEDERAQLESVAELLRIPEAARRAARERPTAAIDSSDQTGGIDHFALRPGDLIVLTGEMSRPREEWSAQLESLGLGTHANVTKKVRLVAAADPDSLSGKARKARDYGIPIVDEAGLVRLLDEYRETQSRETPRRDGALQLRAESGQVDTGDDMFPVDDPEFELLQAEESAKVDASELIAVAFERSGLTRSELARRLGVPVTEVRARLAGERDLTVAALAATLHALGQRLAVSAEDAE